MKKTILLIIFNILMSSILWTFAATPPEIPKKAYMSLDTRQGEAEYKFTKRSV